MMGYPPFQKLTLSFIFNTDLLLMIDFKKKIYEDF